MIKFSIVVPVYNVEKYLSQCVESILSQSYKDFELILVNDGSTDNSKSICKKYAVAHDFIRLINKKNGGLSDARNIGIANAKGEYIILVDADDYIELNSFEVFFEELEKSGNPDVMITRLKKVYDGFNSKYMDYNMPLDVIRNGNKNEIIDWIFTKSDHLWPSVRYIFKRSLVELNNLKFACGYLHEDIDWTPQLFLYAKTFTCSDFYWYNHRIGRSGSITTNKNSKRTKDIISLVSKNIKDKKFTVVESKLRDIIFQRMLKSVFSSLSDYRFYNEKDKKEIEELLNKEKDIFKYTARFKHKVFVFFCRLLGVGNSLTLMRFINKLK